MQPGKGTDNEAQKRLENANQKWEAVMVEMSELGNWCKEEGAYGKFNRWAIGWLQQLAWKIVEVNDGLVRKVAKDHTSVGRDCDDLVSEGKMALYRAVWGFKLDEGSEFSTYALKVVENQITKFLDRQRKDLVGLAVSLDDPGTEDESRSKHERVGRESFEESSLAADIVQRLKEILTICSQCGSLSDQQKEFVQQMCVAALAGREDALSKREWAQRVLTLAAKKNEFKNRDA